MIMGKIIHEIVGLTLKFKIMILSQYLKDMSIIQEEEQTLDSKQAKESNRLTLTICKLNKNIMSQGLKKVSHKKFSLCFNK